MKQSGLVCCKDGIRGFGDPEHGIMLVGQFPNIEEMRTGLPFTGNDGELLNSTLAATGWSRDKVFCTNACCVHDLLRIDVCYPRLIEEIETFKPRLVVTLGATACEKLFHDKLSHCRGALLYTKIGEHECRGMATWLPSAITRADTAEQQNDRAAEFVRDIRKIARYFGPGRNPPERVTKPAVIIYNKDEAQRILDDLPRDKLVTLDIETPIIDKDAKVADPYHKILCVGIGLEDDTQYVFPEDIIGLLDWPTDIQWGGWNLYGFDMVALRDKYGLALPIAHDGMLTSYVRDERTTYGTHKLKNNAREDAGADHYEEHEIRGSFENLAKYNGLDVAYNHRLLRYHLSSFDDDDKKLYYDLLMPAANMYSLAQYEGMRVDIFKWFQLSVKFECRIRELEEELVREAAEYGYPGVINPNSDQQVSRFFFDILGISTELSELTPGGKWSVNKDVLDRVNHPWAAKLRLHRQVTDTKTRYLNGPQAQMKHDAKVHAKVWIPGTTTGRPSYSDPPLQQLPHRRTIGEFAEVRSIFIADDDDHELMAVDYNQGELWILYGYSGDENLHADLTEPWSVTGKADYHSRTCAHGVPCMEHLPFGLHGDNCPACVKWEFDRDSQKHVNFGIPYGETAFGLTRPAPKGTGLPLKQCQDLIIAWYKRNQDVYQWQQSISFLLNKYGFIKTPFGRKRRFPIVVNPKQTRQAINAPIQGTLSDYTLSSAIEANNTVRAMGGRLLVTTHDELLYNIPKARRQEICEYVKYVMTKPRCPGFPSIPVEAKFGQNLYEVSP